MVRCGAKTDGNRVIGEGVGGEETSEQAKNKLTGTGSRVLFR